MTHRNNEIENDKLFIIEVVETGERHIHQLSDSNDGWGRNDFDVLEIPYNLNLSDGSKVKLVVTWASNWHAHGAVLFVNWSSLSTMRDTFYLEPGDEIVFSEPTNGFATRYGEKLFYFTLYRDGVLVDTYQGWLSR